MFGRRRHSSNRDLLILILERTIDMSAALDRITTDVNDLTTAVNSLIAANADIAAQLKALAANQPADDSAALSALADKIEADTAAATAAVAPAPDAPAA